MHGCVCVREMKLFDVDSIKFWNMRSNSVFFWPLLHVEEEMTEGWHFLCSLHFCFYPTYFTFTFFVFLYLRYSWTVSEHIIWHLWNTPRRPAEAERVLKMCERFGSFIKEAHSFFMSYPMQCFPLIFSFFASLSLSFPFFIDIQRVRIYCLTIYHHAANQSRWREELEDKLTRLTSLHLYKLFY